MVSGLGEDNLVSATTVLSPNIDRETNEVEKKIQEGVRLNFIG